MAHTYHIMVQFAAPKGTPSFQEIEELLDQAIAHYNSVSLITHNPKKITGKTIVDSKTLQLDLESEGRLEMPSKALRTFSAFLVSPKTEGNLSACIYGKQIFKMWSEAEPAPVLSGEEASRERILMIRRLTELMLSEKRSDKRIVERIRTILFASGEEEA